MSVRAKFRVQTVQDQKWADGKEVRSVILAPVYEDTPENKSFFAATPSGQITLGCANLKAAEQFNVGQEFYVDFTPASKVVR